MTGDDGANAMVGSGGEEGKKDKGGIGVMCANVEVEIFTKSPALARVRLGRDPLREGLSSKGQNQQHILA